MKKSTKAIEKMLRDAVSETTPDVLGGVLSGCAPSAQKPKGEIITMNPNQNNRKKSVLRPILAAAAALVLVFGTLGVYGSYLKMDAAESVVAIDVNPSIELKLNKAEKVTAVIAVNDDAKAIVDGLKLQGADLDDAIELLVASLVEHGYISELSNSLLLTVENPDEATARQLENRLCDSIDNSLKQRSLNACVMAQTLKMSDEIKEQADLNHISNGKAKLIAAVIAANPAYTFQQLSSMSVNELRLLSDSKNICLENVTSTGVASDKAYIGATRAAQIALSHAGVTAVSASAIKTEFDYEDGRMTYEVEFKVLSAGAKTKYEYEIDALTGAVIDVETEPFSGNHYGKDENFQGGNSASSGAVGSNGNGNAYGKNQDDDDDDDSSAVLTPSAVTVSREQALQIASADARAVTVQAIDIDLESEDGKPVYDVEFSVLQSDGSCLRYSYEIDAMTGAILDKDLDLIKQNGNQNGKK